MFGYKRGAFTGADSDKKGLFEVASGGTLFLDEIGEMDLSLQAKILRALQDGLIRRVGETTEKRVEVRIISATNRDLQVGVEHGTFRLDLYYRLNVFQIDLPPLRNRREDIPALAEHFLEKNNKAMKKSFKGFTRRALDKLQAYAWPGNVRELENAIERAVAVSGDHDGLIRLENLPESLTGVTPMGEKGIQIPPGGLDLESHLARVERQYLQEALRAAGGVRTKAAELLKMSYRAFRHSAKKHGI
jgi:two-component system response regulator PilR (NtrC family)